LAKALRASISPTAVNHWRKEGAKFLPLRFNRKSGLRAPEDERIAHRDEKIAARFE